MANVEVPQAGKPLVVGDNTYFLADSDSGRASQMAIQIELNGGACSYAFKVKLNHPDVATWQTALAYPVSAPTTGASSGATSDVWMIDCSGKRVQVVCSGTSGSPELSFLPVVG